MRGAVLRALGGSFALGVIAALGAASPARAVETDRSWVEVHWQAAEADVHYAVFVSRDGAGFGPLPEALISASRFVLEGEPGEVASVRVAAWDPTSAQLGPLSPASESVYFRDGSEYGEPDTLLADGSFELGEGTPAHVRLAGGDSLGAWEVIGDSVDWTAGFEAYHGTRCVDLHGSGAGGLRQSFPTQPGERYRVRLALAGHPEGGAERKTLEVRLPSEQVLLSFDTSGRSREDMGWRRVVELEFEASASRSLIELASVGRGAFGPVVDAVEVHAIPGSAEPPPEPEPAPEPEPEPAPDPVVEPPPEPAPEPEPEPEPPPESEPDPPEWACDPLWGCEQPCDPIWGCPP